MFQKNEMRNEKSRRLATTFSYIAQIWGLRIINVRNIQLDEKWRLEEKNAVY